MARHRHWGTRAAGQEALRWQRSQLLRLRTPRWLKTRSQSRDCSGGDCMASSKAALRIMSVGIAVVLQTNATTQQTQIPSPTLARL